MQTARAIVSSGRLARVRTTLTSATEGSESEVDDGMRLDRWTDGPEDTCSLAQFKEYIKVESGARYLED